MPAVSQSQANLMRLVRGVQTGDTPKSKVDAKVKKMAKDMDPADVKDFAETPDKGLPVKAEGVMSTIDLLVNDSADFNLFLQGLKREFPKIKLDRPTLEKLHKVYKKIKGLKEVAPSGKGWEKTVKAMKDKPEIDNPWAMAHWMKGKGYKSHKESLNEDLAGVAAGAAGLAIGVAVKLLLPRVFDGLMATLHDIRNFVNPPRYIKFLKQLENNDEFNRQFIALVKERGGMEKFASRVYSNHQVALKKLPALKTALEKFYKEEGLSENQSELLEMRILDSMNKSINKSWPKTLDFLKKKYPDLVKDISESLNEGKYYVGYNKGRGQGKGVFKDTYSTYKDAQKAVEKITKMMSGTINQTAYYVADSKGEMVRETLNEEAPIYKDWDEFVNPHYIIVHLKNGKKLKIDRSRVKGGNTAYHSVLKAFNDNNYKVTNTIVNAMLSKLRDKDEEGKELGKMGAYVSETNLEYNNEEDCGCNNPVTEYPVHSSNRLYLKTALNGK